MRWLARLRGLLLYLLAIGGLLYAAYYATDFFKSGLESHQPLQIEVAPAQSLTSFESTEERLANPNITTDPTDPAGATAPLTNRVVLVVVNGLTQADVDSLPALANDKTRAISNGAYLFTGAVPPSTPALVTLLTGTSPDLSGGIQLERSQPAPNAPTAAQQLGAFDNILNAVKRRRFTTALFGTNDWFTALPTGSLDYYTTFDVRQPANDITDNVVNFLKKKSANFTVVQFSALQQALTDSNGDNTAPLVTDARDNLNKALERLTGEEVNLKQTTLLITGDWDASVPAGDRWTVPLVLMGQAVQPGDRIWARQEDVTATISALLGVEFPRHNQGRILTSLLSMPPIDLGQKLLALVEQRWSLTEAYRTRLGLVLPIALNDPAAVEAEKNIKVARQNFRLGSYGGMEQVLDPVLRYTRTDMDDARQEWFAGARWQRAILAVVFLALPILLLMLWRSAHAILACGGALLASLTPFALHWLAGNSFTFNANSLLQLNENSVVRAGIGVLVGLLPILVFFNWAERRRTVRLRGRVDLDYQQIADLRRPDFPLSRLFITVSIMLAWLVFFSSYIWLVWYYWRFGYIVPLLYQPLLLPGHTDNFLELFALAHLYGFTLAMAVAPFLLIVLYWLKTRLQGSHPLPYPEEPETMPKNRAVLN